MPETVDVTRAAFMGIHTTKFPTVPIAEVPMFADSAEADVSRRIILVVADDPMNADTFAEILNRSGYAAMVAYDGETALETAALVPPELLISNDLLPRMSGVDLAIAVRVLSPDCKVLLFSGQPSTEDLLYAAECDGHQISLLSKPIHPAEMLSRVAEILDSGKFMPDRISQQRRARQGS
jgi:DNA-binding response OmpR family regulator